jgi:hypothetical protein
MGIVLVAAIVFGIISGVVTLVCRLVPRWRPGFRYAWRLLVYPLCGILIANVALDLYAVLVSRFVEHTGWGELPDSTIRRDLARFLVGSAMLATLTGPFVASFVGFFVGAWLALDRAARAPRPA